MTNLLLIYADDLFCYRQFRDTFGQTIQTPNLDRLAEAATVFDDAYCMVPVCGPSRAATATGASPFVSGVLSNGGQEWYDFIPTRDNISALLKREGAYIEWAGKIMHGYGVQPAEQRRQLHHAAMPNGAFTPNLAATDGSVTRIWPQSAFSITAVEGKDAEFYDHRVADYGINAIGRMPEGRPWALFLGFQHPHTQYAAPKWAYDLYSAEGIVEPVEWSHGALPRPTEYGAQFMSDGTVWPSRDHLNWQHHVRAYLACITHFDHHVGRVLDALEASPHAADTAILMLSDHGYHAGDHDVWGKFTLWEEAARTPLIAKLPGQTEGRVVTTPVSLMDIFPTICAVMGVDTPARIHGQSLLPLMPGGSGTYEDRGALTCVYGSVGLRWQDYRYILYPDGTQELYNLVTDPAQSTNLVASQPDIAETCRAQVVLESARYGLYHATDALPEVREARAFALYNGARVTGGTGNDTFFLGAENEIELDPGPGRNRVMLGHWSADKPYTLPEGISDMMIAVKRAPNSPVVHLNDGGVTVVAPQRAWIGHGGAGDDVMSGPAGSVLHGGAGDDVIRINGATGAAHGGAGNDTLSSSGAALYGGDGDDVLILTGAGRAYGDAGNDSITGSSGNDTLFGGTGDDTISGGLGDDEIHGGPGHNLLSGGGGDDTIHASGVDTVSGGAGNDRFVIGPAAQVLITDWQMGEVIDLTAWGGAPQYRQINTHQVLIHSGARSVMVTCAAPITPAAVAQTVVTA